jgi:hypothetical protein
MMKNLLRSPWRFLQADVTLIVAISAMAFAHRTANGEAVAWDNSAGTFDQRWVYQFNWNPDIVPTSTSDVTLTAITPNLVIDAQGTYVGDFVDPELKANSLTISTHNAFTVAGHAAFGFHTSLTLTSGDLTRLDVLGVEGGHSLELFVRLAADGEWDIGGSGSLSVPHISESGGSRTFTKTGPGTLKVGFGQIGGSLSTSGAKTISQGIFEGRFRGTGVATIAPGAIFHVISGTSAIQADSTSPIILNGSGSGSLSMVKVGTGSGEISGQLTIEDTPNISVHAGGLLHISGGIASVNDSGFSFFGPGELVLSGPGTGAIVADIRGGQVRIAHNSALGTGRVFIQPFGGGSVAFADGVTFANPISLVQGTIRGLGNSTVSSDITLFPNNNHTLHVPQLFHKLAFTGTIADFGGGASLTKTGQGTVELRGNTTVLGGLTLAEGALANNGVISGGATHVAANTVLFGAGQFADLNVADLGIFRPGAVVNFAFSPAAVAIEDLVLGGPMTDLSIQIGGAAPGTEHDQLRVSGNATLAGKLQVSLHSFSLSAGQEFVVIDVGGTLSGQFAGLSEGALLGSAGGRELFITYAGGDGNDVALFTAGPAFTADFDEDGDVDSDDLADWQTSFGPTSRADADDDGDSDGADFLPWQQQLGSGAPTSGAAAAVPEPAASSVAALLAAWLIFGRRRLTV